MTTGERQVPLLVYDGECDFCRYWVQRWKRLTGDRIAYAPFQKAAAAFPSIPLEEFRGSVHVIFPNGAVFKGAHGVYRTLAHAGARQWPLWAYERVPGFAALSEAGYRWVARYRGVLWRVVKRFPGRGGG